MGYTHHLLGRVSVLVATCTRHVTRATRRLLRHRSGHGRGRKKQPLAAPVNAGDGDKDEGLWRRTILMGERCQPLNFAGAIHYDSFGRRLAEPPTPRGSTASLFCRCSDAVPASEAIKPESGDI